ncbi:MAG TPA: magnesium transporter [Candidatus Nanoarchaeia archaeon]|nr:magnesium transporter [Candidatus Nanoarchaeia archaeon]
MNIFDKDFKEILGSQVVSIIGGIIAGIFLASFQNKLILIPGILILIPGFLEMRGNISGSLASRISSGLFLGIIKARNPDKKIINGNVIASFLLAIFVSFCLGLFAFLFGYILLNIYFPKIILIAVIAGIIANIIEIIITLVVTFYLFRKGHDPNNVMGPFLTSTGDISSIIALLIAMVIV